MLELNLAVLIWQWPIWSASGTRLPGVFLSCCISAALIRAVTPPYKSTIHSGKWQLVRWLFFFFFTLLASCYIREENSPMTWDETRLRSKLLAAWWSKEKITEEKKSHIQQVWFANTNPSYQGHQVFNLDDERQTVAPLWHQLQRNHTISYNVNCTDRTKQKSVLTHLTFKTLKPRRFLFLHASGSNQHPTSHGGSTV